MCAVKGSHSSKTNSGFLDLVRGDPSINQGVGVVNFHFCSTSECSDSPSRCLAKSSALMKFGHGSKDEKFKNSSSHVILQLFTSLIFLHYVL